jgi:hypothetical protein
MLALSVQEHYPNASNHTEKALQTGRDLLPNTNVSTLAKNVVLNEKSSPGEIAAQQTSSADPK